MCLTFLILCSTRLSAQAVIINELYNSSLSTDEWLELLVVGDNVDMRGWSLQDFSSSGNPGGILTFASTGLWSSVAKGTIIVVGQSGATFTEDTDPSDHLLMIKSTNGIYFSGTVFLFAGASDAVEIRDASSTHIFGVSWGTANAASIGAPKAHFTSASSSNTATFFNGNSVAGLTSTANWTQNSAATTRGAGNGTVNSAWIASLRTSTTGDGSGRVAIDPDTLNHSAVTDIRLTYHVDTSFTITDLRVILPSAFIWGSPGSVIMTHNSGAGTITVSGDTITFPSISLTADSTEITISNMTAPETTGIYPFAVQTKATTAFANVSPPAQILVFGIPMDIADVKQADVNGIPLKLGQFVTIRGIVTVANQFGGPSYIQDNTGGMAIFGSLFSTAVTVGDEVTVSGGVNPFNGLTEITLPTSPVLATSGNVVAPQVVTCAQVAGDGAGGVELYEGSLIRLNGVAVTDTFGTPIANWTVSGSGTNYRITDGTGHVDVRIDNGVDFAKTPAPQGAFDLVGVVSQFKSSSPFIGGYQVMPRFAADIVSSGPIIATSPIESNLTPTSFTVSWTTVNNGSTRLRYGTTAAYELGLLAPNDLQTTAHGVDISGLQPASIYHVGVFSVASGDTSFASDLVVSTNSPAQSTGVMNVYFNKSVNTSVALGELALGNQDLVSRVITRINSAHRSIDVCVYNLGGAGQGDAIATALLAAKSRGVKVRVICEYDNSTNSPFTTLAGGGIPLITDRYDLVWFGAGLMHNKFFVFDGRGGAPESTWVWSGSWNPTDPGTNADRQNSIEIQDQALAGAYTTEFSEMWGSSGDAPNQSASRFGARKTNNVPHNFIINSVPVSVYFSPSDQTTAHIGATLSKATHSVSVSLLTFTRKDLADTVIAKKNAGKKTRIVLDNNTDTGNQFTYLSGAGVDIHLKGGGSGLLHHKYAVVDGDDPTATAYLVTGSHNWSNSAENSNDENTLIIQNQRIANLYLQEFTARYYEAGGSDSVRLTAAPAFSVSTSSINFDTVAVGQSKTDSFTVSNSGSAALTISSAYSTAGFGQFTVTPPSASIVAGGSGKFYVTLKPVVSGIVSGGIVLVHNAPGTPDTVGVQGVGKVPAGMVSVPITVTAGWNMVSLPADVPNPSRSILYGPGSSPAYSYGAGYVAQETVLTRKGYWVRFPSDSTFGIVGFPIAKDTLQVGDKWNMIGSISSPVMTSTISPTGGTTSFGSFFKYKAGYFVADTVVPGQAYWVKTSGAGGLILSSTGFAKGIPHADPLFSMNSVAFSDEGGGTQKLYIGVEQGNGFDLSAYELPPVPPAGAFDARFASGRMVETYPRGLDRPAVYDVAVHSRFSSIKVVWHIDSQDRNSYTLIAVNGTVAAPVVLRGDGEITIPAAPAGRYRITVAKTVALPATAMLLQNYPNPFNPVTTIPFALPVQSQVTLTVFNVLGEAVATLVDHASQDAGYHQVLFDASKLSSGIYYYQLQAVPNDQTAAVFQQVQKLVLIK